MKRTQNGFKQRSKACRFCHTQIGLSGLTNHERHCEKRSPQARIKSAELRQYARNHRNPLPAIKAVKQVRMNGRRLQATISCDWTALRSVILELVPHLTIDKVELT